MFSLWMHSEGTQQGMAQALSKCQPLTSDIVLFTNLVAQHLYALSGSNS